MLFFHCKRLLCGLCSLVTLALTFFVCAFLKDDFGVGEFENASVTKNYYLYSASSLAKQTHSLGFLELPFVEGESVSILFDDEEEAKRYAIKLIEKTGAHLQKVEYLEEVESYYLFSREFGKSVTVSGRQVNLHIAVSGKRVSVGSPIIFGGY